ncbi:MAG: hypothetical protein HN380_27350 [Victivallales bacterium]|nr:hypothetical protein [Victivallales bacterium]
MFKWAFGPTTKRIVGAALLVFVVWQAVVFLRPRPEDVPEEAVALLDGAVADAAGELGDLFAEGAEPARVGLARLRGDPYGTVTERLGEALDAREELAWDRTSVVRRFIQDLGSAAWNSTSLDELATSGRRVKLDALVSGKVVLPEGEDGVPSLELRVHDFRPGGERRVLVVPGRALPVAVEAPVVPPVASVSWRWLFLAALGILAMPWLTPFLTEWALALRANGASALLLAGDVTVDLLLLGVVPGLAARLAGGLMLPALAAAFCAGYSHWACETIAARRR